MPEVDVDAMRPLEARGILTIRVGAYGIAHVSPRLGAPTWTIVLRVGRFEPLCRTVSGIEDPFKRSKLGLCTSSKLAGWEPSFVDVFSWPPGDARTYCLVLQRPKNIFRLFVASI